MAAIYLLPLLLFVALRSRRETPLWQTASDIPLALAIDLAAVLLLSRLVRLEDAAIVGRALWLVALTVWGVSRVRRGDPPAWPEALNRRVLVSALLTPPWRSRAARDARAVVGT